MYLVYFPFIIFVVLGNETASPCVVRMVSVTKINTSLMALNPGDSGLGVRVVLLCDIKSR